MSSKPLMYVVVIAALALSALFGMMDWANGAKDGHIVKLQERIEFVGTAHAVRI